MPVFKKKDVPSQALQRAAMAHGLSLFYVKYLGHIEVSGSRGAEVVAYALSEVLATNKARKVEGWKAPKVELSFSASGLRLTDRSTGQIFLDIPLHHVSYCQEHGPAIFAFIALEKDNSRKKCFVFKTKSQAGDIMTSLGAAFNKAKEKEKEKENGGFNGQAQQLKQHNPHQQQRQYQQQQQQRRPQQQQQRYPQQQQRHPQQQQRPVQQQQRPVQHHPQQQQRSQRPRKASQPDEMKQLDREMKEMEANFEADFKFARARAQSTKKGSAPNQKTVPQVNLDEAFAPSPEQQRADLNRKKKGLLPAIDPRAFEASKPSDTLNGFDDQFAPTPSPNVNRGKNPYARKRGAPAPSVLPTASQIKPSPGAVRRGILAQHSPNPQSPKTPTQQQPQKDQSDPWATTPAPSPAATLAPSSAKPAAAPATPQQAKSSKGLLPPISAAGFENDNFVSPHPTKKEDEAPTSEPEAPSAQLPPSSNDRDSDDSDDDDVDDLLQELEQEQQQLEATQAEEEEASEEEAPEEEKEEPEATSSVETQNGAPPSEYPDIIKLSQHVWGLATPDEEGFLPGAQLKPLMEMSKLPQATLGTIWTMLDDQQLGKMNFRQVGFLLGLMSQAQRGEELDKSTVGPSTPGPILHGLKPME
eukprot:m.40492 g.40492  ORF g.40492 m.40492 type:complete len:641 (-) comp16754_c0_seq4:158-2080(-)